MDWVISVFVNLVVCSTNAVVCGQTCQYGMGYGHSYCRWLYYQQQHSESAYLCQLVIVKVTDPVKFLKLDISRSGTQNSPFSSLAVAVTIASTYCAWPRRDGQAELAWLAGYVVKQFTCPKAVTHPTTNRAQCRSRPTRYCNTKPPNSNNYSAHINVSFVFLKYQ